MTWASEMEGMEKVKSPSGQGRETASLPLPPVPRPAASGVASAAAASGPVGGSTPCGDRATIAGMEMGVIASIAG